MLQVSLKKGGAGREVIKALCFLLATPDEVQKAEEAGRSTGQWLADVLEYRQLPTATTPFDYITLSNATEMRVQQAGSPPLSLQAQLLMPVLAASVTIGMWRLCIAIHLAASRPVLAVLLILIPTISMAFVVIVCSLLLLCSLHVKPRQV